MGTREAISGAVFGAFVMVAVSLVFAWVATGPDHQDWSRMAIAMAPFAAVFGALAGAVGGLLVRVTRPHSRRTSEQSARPEKRGLFAKARRDERGGRNGRPRWW